jgi:hypothetical protein
MEHLEASIPTHHTTVEASPTVPSAIDAAVDVVVKLKVSCPEGCDLRGAPVAIMAGDGVVATSELTTWEDKANLTSDVIFKAPETIGEYAWRIVFAPYNIHDESTAPISFATKPHATSMSVWGVPSPVVVNTSFAVHAGVKCAVPCSLAGRVVEIWNGADVKVGEGRLAESPWPGTDALYWAAVEAVAPADEGVFAWTVRFPPGDFSPPHDESSVPFSFRTARPPEAAVTIEIVAKDTALPLEDVEVRLGAYEAFTDERGVARVAVAHGTYGLDIRKDGYKADPITVDVRGDITVRVDAASAPTKAELEDMMKRFEGETWR